MSTLAVFLLLGGGAYAASELAANSVGSRELKNNAVSSAEVKDRSLKASDFADGQLPTGAQGPKGDQGAKGDRGPAGAAASSGNASDLLDPSTDLSSGKVVINIDGVEIATGSAFRIGCPTATTCAVDFGKAVDGDLALNAWFEAAQLGDIAAVKNFSLVVDNAAGMPVQRYHVEHGKPISYYDNGLRMAIRFAATNIQRVAP